MVFPIIYKGEHARGKGPARKTRIDHGYLRRRAKERRIRQKNDRVEEEARRTIKRNTGETCEGWEEDKKYKV